MFVDDGLTAAPRLSGDMRKLAAASIEACYLLLGYPGPIKSPYLPPAMAWDKMEARRIGIDRIALGTRFMTPFLDLTIEIYKAQRLKYILLNTWNVRARLQAQQGGSYLTDSLAIPLTERRTRQ